MPTHFLVPLTALLARTGLTQTSRALEKWVLAQLGTIRHELRVQEISGKLFDLTSPLHRLDGSYRRLLRMAAIVHDVGRSVDDATHPREGARLILETQKLPLDEAQRRALAYLTRHHRGQVPEAGSDKFLSPADDHHALAITLGLLRAADALDSRCLESPRLLFGCDGRRLQIHCFLERDSVKARKVFTRKKKYRLLESMLDCHVEVVLSVERAIRQVA